jgi:molybdate transport system permease protein
MTAPAVGVPGRATRGATALGWPIQGLAFLAALTLGLPVVVLVGRAVLDGALFASATMGVVVDALVLSLLTTSISLGLTVVIGLPLALLLARRSFRGQTILETVIDLPIVLPPSVAGLALLLVFGRRGLLGESLSVLGIEIAFTTIAVILAQTFVSAPFFIRSARTGFASVDRDLEDAARVDGASERQLFRAITVPLASAALAAGLVMSWARALGEFGATLMFAGSFRGVTQTAPLAIYERFSTDFTGALALSAVLVAVSAALLLSVKLLTGSPWLGGAAR